MSVAECCGPPGPALPDAAAITDDLEELAARQPDHPLFARETGAGWTDVSAGEFAAQVRALACGLVAAGVKPGDRVAIMSATSCEWVRCDYAIWTAGGVSVPIYETASVTQARWILRDSAAVAVFAGGERCARVAAEAGARLVWRTDGPDLDRLAALGSRITPPVLAQRRAAVLADHPATIVYTSGTTGRPKGCVLTHRNLLAETAGVLAAPGIIDRVLTPGTSVLLFLPLAHILTRVVQLAAVRAGARTGHLGDLARLPAVLRSFRPTAVAAVPRVFEKLRDTAEREADGGIAGRIFRAAERTAVAWSEAEHPGRLLSLRRSLFDRLVYRRLRAALGGRVEYVVSGGAALSPHLAHFLRGAGIRILEGYGLTETTAGVTLNLPGAQRIGTVGRPLPGTAVGLAADGEILVRGPAVFAGYWNDEASTIEATAPGGWFRTGDLGSLDDGYLTVSGRKKDLLVTASGKNIAAAYFEDSLRAHWLIDQCVVTGDRLPFVGALVALDREAFAAWKLDRAKPAAATVADLRDDADLRALLQEAIDEVNSTVSAAETIKRFRVLGAEFSVGDELTPTLKVRRRRVLEKYSGEVAELYAARQ
ncbi:AMP-dependent synthetase/ligase [Amycolatopsis panacis]|uniref:Long-chain fatty acid--CoA ligase n=1 Tax=Amycolatopsis panacis TaxID=2340917 RepID=A0A419I6S4_9PSEU|nr:long-chain fatty acid--CoA ligase [Amycolatopsis panacis]RJQ87238.1 long-chain fatty acid--CoA ligase [Amycolatopsis panacis]